MKQKNIIFEKPLFFDRDYLMVEIDVEKLDHAWKKDPFYVGNEFKINRKYRQAFYYINKHNKCSAPHIGFDGLGDVGFYDGRHRFAVLRDMGRRKVIVAVSKKDFNRLVKHFS